jgi:hypothetical protein
MWSLLRKLVPCHRGSAEIHQCPPNCAISRGLGDLPPPQEARSNGFPWPPGMPPLTALTTHLASFERLATCNVTFVIKFYISKSDPPGLLHSFPFTPREGYAHFHPPQHCANPLQHHQDLVLLLQHQQAGKLAGVCSRRCATLWRRRVQSECMTGESVGVGVPALLWEAVTNPLDGPAMSE